MNKRSLILCTCAMVAVAFFGCNENKQWTDSPVCGNGIVERGEVCDVQAVVGCDMFDPNQHWLSGTPGCTSTCELTQGTCVASTVSQTCGNGKLDQGEACDGTEFSDKTLSCATNKGEGATGVVTCNSDCSVNFSNCQAADNSVCGDGLITGSEKCDGENLGDNTCAKILDDENASGTLSCANCVLDASQCVGSSTTAVCGDGIKNGEELCDKDDFGGLTCEDEKGAGYTGSLKCSDDCTQIDVSECVSAEPVCGDGIRNGEELCDKDDFGGLTCEDEKGAGYTGSLKCSDTCDEILDTECVAPVPQCGDGIKNGNELCDGQDFGEEVTCSSVKEGDYDGKLKCSSTCDAIDDSECIEIPATCDGDAIDEDEECDGENMPSERTCDTELGVEGATGSLKCTKACKLDASECVAPAVCGDGQLDEGEDCEKLVDGEDVSYTYRDDATCVTFHGEGATGNLICNDDCTINSEDECVAAPPAGTCNNNQLDEGEEECDKVDGVDAFCSQYQPNCPEGTEFVLANAFCNDNCTVNLQNACVKLCGNGQIDAGEACDGDNVGEATCSSVKGGNYEGNLKCADDCSEIIDTECSEIVVNNCGNGQIDEDEQCDGDNIGEATCNAGTLGSVTCSSSCQLVYDACKPGVKLEIVNDSDSGAFTTVKEGDLDGGAKYYIKGHLYKTLTYYDSTQEVKDVPLTEHAVLLSEKMTDSNKIEISGFNGLKKVTMKVMPYTRYDDRYPLDYLASIDSVTEPKKLSVGTLEFGQFKEISFDFNDTNATKFTFEPEAKFGKTVNVAGDRLFVSEVVLEFAE